MNRPNRTLLGIAVVLVISALLSFDVPGSSTTRGNLAEHAFWFQLQSALVYLVAVTAGAIVARGSFVGPALSLALLGWLLVVYLAYDIAQVAESARFIDVAAENALGLVLLGIAAVSGARLGRWFYKHEFENATAAS